MHFDDVAHRPDDLEKKLVLQLRVILVAHRPDDLEI